MSVHSRLEKRPRSVPSFHKDSGLSFPDRQLCSIFVLEFVVSLNLYTMVRWLTSITEDHQCSSPRTLSPDPHIFAPFFHPNLYQF